MARKAAVRMLDDMDKEGGSRQGVRTTRKDEGTVVRKEDGQGMGGFLTRRRDTTRPNAVHAGSGQNPSDQPNDP